MVAFYAYNRETQWRRPMTAKTQHYPKEVKKPHPLQATREALKRATDEHNLRPEDHRSLMAAHSKALHDIIDYAAGPEDKHAAD